MKNQTLKSSGSARLSGILALGLATGLTFAQEDYSSWTRTKSITINTTATGANVTSGVGGFPVLVRLTSAHAEIFAQAKSGGADLRFRRLPGPHLPYQIESWDSAGQSASIWVRLDTVLGNNNTQTFNIYWGKSTATAASSGAATFDTGSGYQGVWHFANTLSDATVNAVNGTDEGTADAVGAIGRGRSFNGSSRILLGNHAKMLSGDANRFTVESWANWTSIGTSTADRYRCIINHGTTNNADQVFLYARNPSAGGTDPHYSFGYYTGSASNAALAYGIAGDAGTWVHVTGVYDGSEWRVYRNGALAASIAKDGSPVNSAEDWIIGAWGTSRYFLGSLDEIRFSSRVRSDAWIKLAYETQKTGSTVLSFGTTVTPTALRENAGEGAREFSGVGGSVSVRPSAGGLVFGLPSGKGDARLSVADARGRVVWSRFVTLGEAAREVATEGLAPGAYTASAALRNDGAQGRVERQTVTVR